MSLLGMEPAMLSEYVEILEKRTVEDEGAGRETQYVGIGVDAWEWVRIQPLSARERRAAQQMDSPAQYRVRMRARSDITCEHRIRWQSVELELTSGPINADERGEYIDFEAAEVRP